MKIHFSKNEFIKSIEKELNILSLAKNCQNLILLQGMNPHAYPTYTHIHTLAHYWISPM